MIPRSTLRFSRCLPLSIHLNSFHSSSYNLANSPNIPTSESINTNIVTTNNNNADNGIKYNTEYYGLYRPPKLPYRKHISDASFITHTHGKSSSSSSSSDSIIKSSSPHTSASTEKKKFYLSIGSLPTHTFSFRITQFHHKIVARAVEAFELTANKLNLYLDSIVALPTTIQSWTVLRSPFTHKQAQEAFERRTHKRVVTIRIDPKLSDYQQTALIKNVFRLMDRVAMVTGHSVSYHYTIPANTPIKSGIFIEPDQVYENDDEDKNWTKGHYELLMEVIEELKIQEKEKLKQDLKLMKDKLERNKVTEAKFTNTDTESDNNNKQDEKIKQMGEALKQVHAASNADVSGNEKNS